ncbi:MAG: hypothetical protein HQM08_30240 [Candidatus Riflebacteria bacterium]|nr:hypothetical protein [Candidatus Riflebacteria bacterium]
MKGVNDISVSRNQTQKKVKTLMESQEYFMNEINYHLKLKELRESINLKDYEDEILDAIKEVLPESKANVYKDHFSIEYTSPKLSHGLASKLGSEICKAGNSLNKYVTKYIYKNNTMVSRQLFVCMDK